MSAKRRTGSFTPERGRITQRFARQRGKLLIYSGLLILVLVSMFLIYQAGSKRNGGGEMNSNAPVTFTREGELTLVSRDGIDIVTIDIEIADDDYQRERGLMFRRSMDELQGMLFIFEEMDYRSFWMKNTHLALDIMYLDKDRIIVDIHENTPPYSTGSIPSALPALYVLEVNAGFVARYQIKVGDQIRFSRVF